MESLNCNRDVPLQDLFVFEMLRIFTATFQKIIIMNEVVHL